MAAKQGPVKAQPNGALLIDELLVDWILIPQVGGYIVARLYGVTETKVREQLARAEVPRARLHPVFHFVSTQYPMGAKKVVADDASKPETRFSMLPVHTADRVEAAYGLPRSAELTLHATLLIFDFLSEQDELTRKFVCRRLREAARVRMGGVVGALRSGT